MTGTDTYAIRQRLSSEVREELWAAHHAALAKLAGLARERSDTKKDALDAALEPLMVIARTLKTGPDKDAFAAHIIRAIHNSWK